MLTYELSESEFNKLFDEYNRSENFNWEARKALFDHLETFSDGMGEDVKIDIISLCCEYKQLDKTEIEPFMIENELIIAEFDDGTALVREG